MKDSDSNDPLSCFLFILVFIIIIMFWHVILAAGVFGVVAWAVIKMLSSSPDTSPEHMNSQSNQSIVLEESRAQSIHLHSQASANVDFAEYSDECNEYIDEGDEEYWESPLLEDDHYDEDSYEDLYVEGLDEDDITFEDADSEY